MAPMRSASTVDFAAAARTLTATARRRGLVGPSFRSPPRLVGVDRTIRRRRDAATVAVRMRGRPWPAVVADMVEGVVVTNRLGPPESDRVRTELWEALGVEAPGVVPHAPSHPGAHDERVA